MRRLAVLAAAGCTVAGRESRRRSAAVRPRTATVTTVPATAGLELTYRGRVFRTGSDGSVTIDVSATPRPDDPRLEMRSAAARSRPTGDVRFSRWLGTSRARRERSRPTASCRGASST